MIEKIDYLVQIILIPVLGLSVFFMASVIVGLISPRLVFFKGSRRDLVNGRGVFSVFTMILFSGVFVFYNWLTEGIRVESGFYVKNNFKIGVFGHKNVESYLSKIDKNFRFILEEEGGVSYFIGVFSDPAAVDMSSSIEKSSELAFKVAKIIAKNDVKIDYYFFVAEGFGSNKELLELKLRKEWISEIDWDSIDKWKFVSFYSDRRSPRFQVSYNEYCSSAANREKSFPFCSASAGLLKLPGSKW